MNSEIKLTLKILLIVMMATFCYNGGGGVIIKCYEGWKIFEITLNV